MTIKKLIKIKIKTKIMLNKNFAIRFFTFAVILFLAMFAIGGTFISHADNDSSLDDLIEGRGKFKFDIFPPGLEKKFEIRQPSLNVNPQGKVLITAGEVTEANWPNLKVKTWGLVLNVHVMSDARIIGGTATTTTVGDKVDILGDMEKDTGLIHAKTFKNRSQSLIDSENLRQRIADLMRQIEELRAKIKALIR